MRDMKLQIQKDVARRGVEDNIKVGRGGIREVEFIAQVFQLIRGGQDKTLQIKPTLAVLQLLAEQGVLSQAAVDALSESYIYLRNLEHRIMYVDDQQTQDLPKTEDSKQLILRMLNIASWDVFLQQLEVHRSRIQMYFDTTFSDAASEEKTYALEAAIWQGDVEQTSAQEQLQAMGYEDSKQAYNYLYRLRKSNRYLQLPVDSQSRFDQLMPNVIHQAAQLGDANTALLRTINFIESICRRASYLALLTEFPHALHLVVKLFAASPWLSEYLTSHPILLDELLDREYLYAKPDFEQMNADLQQKIISLEGDAEMQMNAMRHFKHAAILRFAAQDIAGLLPLETLSDYLSELAKMVLQISLQVIWQSLQFKHINQPKFAVIGYGKLGGKELGYMSDLDIIFLYQDEHPDAAEIYARYAQRINSWFNSLTHAGLLYETDLELRPDGNSGLLVSSVDAFHRYQLDRAWVWEHQAITRAAFIAGDASIGALFEVIRIEVIMQPRDTGKLRLDVLAMREKMRAAHKVSEETFDLKQSVGGIIDVEFLVQYLLLLHAEKHDELTENIGNIALLEMLGSLSVIDARLAKKVADAYREYRRLQHAAGLQGKQAKVDVSLVKTHAEAVEQLWHAVFSV
jgi:glutamate-ammonia-ligase adenylyltransferase